MECSTSIIERQRDDVEDHAHAVKHAAPRLSDGSDAQLGVP
jgi:hypothetical protein